MKAKNISVGEFETICLNYGIKQRAGNVPTYVNKIEQEGIEINGQNIRTFWFKDLERIYGEAPSQIFQKFVDEITEQKTEETKREKNDEVKEVLSNPIGTLLPDFLTSKLLEAWSKMKTVDRMMMFQKTPKDKIKQVIISGKEKDNTAVYAPYVEGNYMIKEANACFLFDWEFKMNEKIISLTDVCVIGVIRANIDGKYITRPAVGYTELNARMTANLAIKSATTDAIKKGLSMFGFNSDVYSGEI